MKALVNLVKYASIILTCYVTLSTVDAQTKIFKKNLSSVIVSNSKDDYESPYSSIKLDYHSFKAEGESPWEYTKGDCYIKYKAMYDFRCK